MAAMQMSGKVWQSAGLSAAQTLGWAFLCLHGWVVSEAVGHTYGNPYPPHIVPALSHDGWGYVEQASASLGTFGSPLAIVIGACRYSMPPVRWWKIGAPILGTAAAFGTFLVAPGLLFLMPFTYLLSWGAVGLLVGGGVSQVLPRLDRTRALTVSVLAGCVTGFGLSLLSKRLTALSYGGEQVAIASPVLMLAVFVTYALLQAGAHVSDPRRERTAPTA